MRNSDEDRQRANFACEIDGAKDSKCKNEAAGPSWGKVMNEVLIVEDHPFVADATQRLLGASYPLLKSVILTNADDACKAFADPDRAWHRILLDLDIPGAHALSVAAEIQRQGLASITCVVTGNTRSDYVVQIKSIGFLGYVGSHQLGSVLTSLSRRLLALRSATDEQLVIKTRKSRAVPAFFLVAVPGVGPGDRHGLWHAAAGGIVVSARSAFTSGVGADRLAQCSRSREKGRVADSSLTRTRRDGGGTGRGDPAFFCSA